MNKNTHRLIFNKSRSCLMAVAESASSCTNGASGASSRVTSRSRFTICPKTSPNNPNSASNSPIAQSIRAQAAPILIVSSSAQNTSSTTSFRSESKSGLFSNGGLSVTIGKKQSSTDEREQTITAAASTVGSINGNVNLIAGQTFRQVGSDILAPAGDINILAKNVEIVEARETTASQTETKSKQSGLTLAITNPVLSAAQSIQGLAKASGNTSSSRAKGLAAAGAGLTGYTAYNGLTDKAGNFDINKAKDISLSVSIGSSKSQSNSNSTSNTARGSTVAAGNSINITATGAGKDSNILIQGSDIKAGNNASLTADNQVNLLAAKNETSQQSTNSSSSGSIGFSVGGQTGVTLAASKGKGKSDGQGTSYTNSRITAGNTVSIGSGGNTTVKGAVVSANQIKADVGKQFWGDLTIESLQDTNSYTSSQKSVGGSITIGPGGIPTGGSISASKSKIDSNFQSVNQQSGLKAGDGGFQVSVAGNTSLTGGVISSTETAIDNKQNSFTTGGQLTLTDVQNTASFKGTAVGATIGVGSQLGSSGAGVGKMQGSAASTSSSGISGIAGNAAVRTGDAETGLKPIFNADKVQKDIDAQVKITTAFGQQGAKAIGDYAGKKLKEADAKLAQAEAADKAGQTDLANERRREAQDLQDTWGEGKLGRVFLHTALGGLTGNFSGAIGAGVTQAAIPYIGEQIAKLDVPLEVKQAFVQISSGLLGAAVGGPGGAASALNATSQNYLKHDEQLQKASQLAACKTDQCKKDAQAQWDKVSQDRNAVMKDSCTANGPAQCSANVEQMGRDMAELQAAGGDKSKGYTGFTPEERNNIKQVMSQINTNLETMAALGNLQLGTTYSSPSDLVAAGILTEKEGRLLQSSRADNMVGFLGAIALPNGVKANPLRTAGKSSAEELTPAPGKPAKPEGEFRTLGLNNVDPMRLPDGVKMVRELEKGGLSYDDAVRTARSFISSGTTPPVATPLDITDQLVKVVPAGAQPSPWTGYWMRASELPNLQKDPASMANKLGLPPSQQVDSFDVFRITPRQGALVFESVVAPTTVGGAVNTTGGAKQTIVVDRNQFTPPVKIGSITVK